MARDTVRAATASGQRPATATAVQMQQVTNVNIFLWTCIYVLLDIRIYLCFAVGHRLTTANAVWMQIYI